MKTLIILRHGKAEQDFDKDDFDRLLTERGKKNALDMGTFIYRKQDTPELILTSSAKRTTETAMLAAQTLYYAQENIQAEKELYFAPALWIVKILTQLPDQIQSCLLMGHNPGLTDLVNYFGVQLDHLPMASAVCFTFDVGKWTEISSENAIFQWFKPAKEC